MHRVGRVTLRPRGTHGVLWLLLGVTLALAAAFGVAGGVAIAARSSATHRFAAGAEPLAVELQQLYTTLDDADATAAASYLSGPVIGTALRDEYDSDVARAESSLSAASRAVAGDATASARLAAIAARIPVYTDLVATAWTDNRQTAEPQPIGTAYLREASALMRTTLLPATLASYNAEVTSLDAVAGDATGVPWLLTVCLALALGALVVAQWQVTRRTHRLINVGLLTATGVLVAAAVWTGVAVGVHRSDLDAARGQAARVQTLATAADAAIQAHADEALMLLAHGSDNGAYAQDFTARLTTATSAVDAAGTAGAGGARLADAAYTLRGWSTLDGQVRASAAADDYQAAVSAVLGAGSTDAARVGADLDAEMTAAQQSFAGGANSGASALDGLLAGEIAAAVLAAAAAADGINRRLAEYR